MARVRARGEDDEGVKQEVRSVPLSGPYLDDREEQLVLEVLRSGRLSLGPAIDRFEELFAEKVGAPYAAAVSSGTAGLHLLCISAGVGAGDEVITSPYSFAASANCFIYEGAVPVFADIDPRTLNLDPATVEAAVTDRTKAILAVDIYGYPCELDPLQRIADKHGLALIQDSCEALGAEYNGTRLGSHGPGAASGLRYLQQWPVAARARRWRVAGQWVRPGEVRWPETAESPLRSDRALALLHRRVPGIQSR